MRFKPGNRVTWTVAVVLALTVLMSGWRVYVQIATRRLDVQQVVIPVSAYLPGTVRLDHGVWVARQPSGEFYVFLDRDPHRGEPLNWVESKGLFMQAALYRIDGVCYEGPCDPSPGQGLYRVEARLEGQNLIIYPRKIISGGFNPEPSWVTDLKHFFMRTQPNAPAPQKP